MATTTSSTSVSSSSTGAISMLGVGSGIDISSIVDGLVNVEKTQQTALKNRVSQHEVTIAAFQALNTKMSAISTAAKDLNIPLYWKATKATSTSSAVSATTTIGANEGSTTFKVLSLASAQTKASYGSVASTDTVVGTGSLLIGKAGNIGLESVSATGLSSGAHAFKVTQASAGAAIKGATTATTMTFDGSETLNVNIDGVAKSISMTAGTYTQSDLNDMIKTASGGSLSVAVNSDKSLSLSTTHEGSAATLSITGGTALSKLGLSSGTSASGVNGIIQVDGVATTVTDIKPDGSNTVSLNGPSGATVSTSFSGGLRVGDATINSIDLGDGKLSTVVANINSAGLGITASAVQAGVGAYKLQLQSTTTGSDGAVAVDMHKFASTLGDMETINAAQNAVVKVGTGTSAYTVSSSKNTIDGLLPNTSVTVSEADPDKSVTVTVSSDGDAMAKKVQALVDAANDALSFIKENSAYDQETGSAGEFLGDYTVRQLQQQIFSTMSSFVGGASLGSASSIGIKSQENGGFSFDQTAFTAAFTKNPDAVASLFVEGGLDGPYTAAKTGIAEKFATVAQQATSSVDGSITLAIKGQNKLIEDLNDQITAWDTRLENYKNRITTQFSAMDTKVAGYNNLLTWLQGQTKSS